MFVACLVAYLAVLEGFLVVPQFNDIVQIRPASALGPVLGCSSACRAFSVARRPTWSQISWHEGATPFMLGGLLHDTDHVQRPAALGVVPCEREEPAPVPAIRFGVEDGAVHGACPG